MKNIRNKSRKFWLRSFFLLSALALVLFGCVEWDSISIKQIQEDGSEAAIAKAGSIATFTINGHIKCIENGHDNVKFIVSFLAPKSWNVKKHARVTYVTTFHSDPNEELTMSVVPESSLPKNGEGRTWGELLMQDFGVGPNVLSDMEWVTFQTDKDWSIIDGDTPYYTIYIRTNVGELNLKAYLGFFINHSDDGKSSDDDHWKVMFSEEPLEVVGGKGLTIDYSSNHFNKVQPLATLQDDYVTFSFNGGVYPNDLTAFDEVYVEMTAFDAGGNVLAAVTEKSDKTLLARTSSISPVYSKTLWPAGFFSVPEGTTIHRIEYIFSNRDGSVTITQTDEDNAAGDSPVVIVGEKEPFVFELLCD